MLNIIWYTFLIFIFACVMLVIISYFRYDKYMDDEKLCWYEVIKKDISIGYAKCIYQKPIYEYFEFCNKGELLRYVGKNNLYNEDMFIIEEKKDYKVYLIINRRKEVKKEDILKRIENAERELQEVKKELENYKYKCVRWKPKYDKEYYTIISNGEISNSYWYNENVDFNRYAINNCFRTQEDAQKAIERQKIKTMLEDIALELNAGKIIDWEDNLQDKFFIKYDFNNHRLSDNIVFDFKVESVTYCLNSDFLDVAIERIGKTRLENYIKGV